MCAICGIINKNNQQPNEALLQQMTRSMRHRGPDDEGFHIKGSIGLGFQRLSIIDLSSGHQPMTNEDGTIWIVFNGEIYNFQRLREDLIKTGRHDIKTKSDTEVIIHLYEEYGENVVDYLRGMFAFAIWDEKKKSLFMARDRYGKKPLVYANLSKNFIFSSELNALVQHPELTKEIDHTAIDQYLTYQYIPSPRTIYKSVRKLPPGHTLTFKDNKIKINRYWRPTFAPKTKMSYPEAQEAMMEKLKESVKLRMISDVPLGAFLSGGKDSSTVVGLMSEISNEPVKTFTIGFEEQNFSELEYAREVANRFGCDHHELIVKPHMMELLPKLAMHYGEPYADSSALPSYYVSKMARSKVTVALVGDGGDETFAGYPRYQAMRAQRLLNLIPRIGRRGILTILKCVPDGPPPYSLSWRLKRLFGLGIDDVRTTYSDTLSFFKQHAKKPLYSDFMKEETKESFAPDFLNQFLEEAKELKDIDPYLYTDQLSYLPDCLMVKMDIASMANSLEVRSPFLDHEFGALVGSFPSSWKLNWCMKSKHILTEKIRGWMPDSIITHKKQGFAAPISQWFQGAQAEHIKDMLLSDKALKRGLFNEGHLRFLIDEHLSGKVSHGYELWALLILEQWFQVFMD